MLHSKLKKLTLALLMGTMLVACSDAEVSSPGENAQVDTGGTGGGCRWAAIVVLAAASCDTARPSSRRRSSAISAA